MRVTLVGLIAGGMSGVPRYAVALTSALDRVSPEFPDLSLRLLTTPAGAERTGVSRIEVVRVRSTATEGPRRILAEQLAARREPADLLYFFDLTGPLLAPRRAFVCTLHDVAIRRGLQGPRVAHKQVLQPLAVRRARAIISVSEFARAEAVRHFGANPSRIHVIHSGPGFTSREGDSAGPTGHAGSPVPSLPYVMYVGNFIAHKNLPFLIRAFGSVEPPVRMLLVGSWGDDLGAVRGAIAASRAAERIEVRSGVSDADLDRLYRGAVALLLPSLYEGFGLTALEAMSRGCPVLASDIPALREVCDDGVRFLSPSDEGAWVAAIRELVANAGARDELQRRGAAVAGRYSWEATARGVCEVLLQAGRTGLSGGLAISGPRRG